MKQISRLLTTIAILTIITGSAIAQQGESPEWHPDLTNDWTQVEDSVYTTAPGEPPSDAIILFDGTDLSQWTSAPGYFPDIPGVPDYLEALEQDHDEAPWSIENGAMTVVPGSGNIMTKQNLVMFSFILSGEHRRRLTATVRDAATAVCF